MFPHEIYSIFNIYQLGEAETKLAQQMLVSLTLLKHQNGHEWWKQASSRQTKERAIFTKIAFAIVSGGNKQTNKIGEPYSQK